MNRYRALSFLLLLVGFATQARAEILLGFSASPSPGSAVFWAPPTDTPAGGSATFVVTPGEAVRLSLFLLERGGDTRLSQEGIFQIGLNANFDPTAGEVGAFVGKNLPLVSPTNAVPVFPFNQLYPEPSLDSAAGTLTMQGAIPPDDFANDIVPGKNTGSTFVGFFDFTLRNPGTTTITFSDPDPSPDANGANNLLALQSGGEFVSLDPELFSDGGFSPSTITITSVTAIPEPSSVLALGVVGAWVTLRRRRNRCR